MASRFARRCLPLVTGTHLPVHTIPRAHIKCVTSVRYAQTRATSPAQRRPADTETYDISAVPFADFNAAIDMTPERFDLKSAQEYYELLTEYASLLAAGKTPRSSRISDERFSAEILHDLGSILRSLPRQSKQSQGLLLQVWSHATELGFTPSLLSLCLFTAHAKGWGKLHWLKKYESQFKKFAADGKDPNVLFVEASLQSGQGNHAGAAKLLERARQINDADYEWRPTAELLLARTYIELGRKQEAIEVLLPLVETKWNDAEYELGKLMRETGGDMEEARQYIYQSTRSGQYERCALLAEMASKAAENATDEASKEEHRRWAVEWSRLANHHAQM